MLSKLNILFFLSATLFTCNFCIAQFNTLTFNAPINEDTILISATYLDAPDQDSILIKKVKKKRVTKKDLKLQLDSLQSLIIQSNIISNKPLDVSDSNKSIKELDTKSYIKQYEIIELTEINKISMPLSNLQITSNYGNRFHPIHGINKMHNGTDFKAYYENVYVVLDGVISESGWDPSGGGNYMKVKHSDRFETLYLHLSQLYYSPGEVVKAGYVIAKSGNSGSSTAPHLHFAVKENGKFINPIKFLNQLIEINNLIAINYEHK